MEIEIFTLCDYTVDNGGKLTVVGTFDNISQPNLPFQQMLGIAIRLRFSERQVGEHSIELKISDPTNNSIGNINGGVNVATPMPPMTYSAINMAINFGLQIKTKGIHTIELHIDNEFQSGLSFHVQ